MVNIQQSKKAIIILTILLIISMGYIGIDKYQESQETKLLNTISQRSLGLAPKTVDGRKLVTTNSSVDIACSFCSAFHFAIAYAVIGFLTLSSSSNSSLVSDIPYILCDEA